LKAQVTFGRTHRHSKGTFILILCTPQRFCKKQLQQKAKNIIVVVFCYYYVLWESPAVGEVTLETLFDVNSFIWIWFLKNVLT